MRSRFEKKTAKPLHFNSRPQKKRPRAIWARMLEDMTEAEIQALEKQYGCPVIRPTKGALR